MAASDTRLRPLSRLTQAVRREKPVGPPSTPGDWENGPPDFVGAGVQRAGTTWLHELLITHPLVHANQDVPKELHFFDDLVFESNPADGVAASYARWFPRPSGCLVGEWTPRYLHNPWTPGLLRVAAPDAKVLISFRDPLSRFWSGLEHARRRETRAGRRMTALLADDAASRSRYGAQLGNFLRYIPRDQVLILQYERACRDPQRELDRIWRFLGLTPVEVPEAVLRRPVGVTDQQLEPLERDPATAEAVASYLDRDIADFLQLAPEIDPELWPQWNAVASGLAASG